MSPDWEVMQQHWLAFYPVPLPPRPLAPPTSQRDDAIAEALHIVEEFVTGAALMAVKESGENGEFTIRMDEGAQIAETLRKHFGLTEEN